jgi:hypothetical protein
MTQKNTPRLHASTQSAQVHIQAWHMELRETRTEPISIGQKNGVLVTHIAKIQFEKIEEMKHITCAAIMPNKANQTIDIWSRMSQRVEVEKQPVKNYPEVRDDSGVKSTLLMPIARTTRRKKANEKRPRLTLFVKPCTDSISPVPEEFIASARRLKLKPRLIISDRIILLDSVAISSASRPVETFIGPNFSKGVCILCTFRQIILKTVAHYATDVK